MIKSVIYFNREVTTKNLVTTLIDKMSDPVRPKYFTEDEGKIDSNNLISNRDRFNVFDESNKSLGYILYAENRKISFDISLSKVDYTKVSMWLNCEVKTDWVENFFQAFVDFKPIYGYACDCDEYEHRNLHYKRFKNSSVESWVGRNLDKYISGVYWYTFLSEHLLKRHAVQTSDLSNEASVHKSFNEGPSHLFRYFENSQDWLNYRDRLDDLCENIDGIFSIRKVNLISEPAQNSIELGELLYPWK